MSGSDEYCEMMFVVISGFDVGMTCDAPPCTNYKDYEGYMYDLYHALQTKWNFDMPDLVSTNICALRRKNFKHVMINKIVDRYARPIDTYLKFAIYGISGEFICYLSCKCYIDVESVKHIDGGIKISYNGGKNVDVVRSKILVNEFAASMWQDVKPFQILFEFGWEYTYIGTPLYRINCTN